MWSVVLQNLVCLHWIVTVLNAVYKQEIRSVELGVCPMQLFRFWSRDVHPVQNMLLCTKFHENRMKIVLHLGIVSPPYETTHEVSVAGRSCLSNFMSIWYTDLKILLFEFFVYLAWNAYSGPKIGVLVDFGHLIMIIHHRDPQKAHPCVNRRLLSYQL